MVASKRSRAAREIIQKARAANPTIVEEVDFTSGPGRFEGQADPYLTYVLHSVALDTSWLDDEASNEIGADWAGRIGCFLLTQDTQGFCSAEEYQSQAQARRAFRRPPG